MQTLSDESDYNVVSEFTKKTAINNIQEMS
jgi:hypothetical protein